MKIEQLYTECLAEAAYYIESDGEVAIIDPLRETGPYLEKAAANGAKIKYVFETHFHADFVSGHVDLAAKSGATIVYGPTAETGYQVHVAEDGEVFTIGKLTLTVLHTPGHTPESTTYLLRDEAGKDHCIFSGDTLFIGDVGRPDLAIKGNLTREDLAGLLFDSLRTKIMPLADDVIVYPAHGAGSSCGKNMSSETFDTLGHQKQTNYALRADMTKQEFIHEVTDGILPPPQYFPKNAMLNKHGYDNIDEVMSRGLTPLSVEALDLEVENGALVLDVRSREVFPEGFVPGSWFIGLDGGFAGWVGALITDLKRPLVLVVEEGKEEEAVRRLARVGYDNTRGFLKGEVQAWRDAGRKLDTIESISAEGLALVPNDERNVVDVRKTTEFGAEHLENATNYPLDYIQAHLGDLPRDEKQYVHCLSGYRSLIAVSILKAQGYTDLVNVLGGFEAIQKTGLPVTDFVCPSEA